MADTSSVRWRRRHRLKILLLLGTGVVLTALTLSLYSADALRRAELSSVDARFAVRGTESPPKDLVVVGIDDVTFGDLGLKFEDWPRRWHAQLLRRLTRARVKVVAYDVQFTEESESLAGDFALYEAAGRARPVVFSTTEVDEKGGTNVLGGDDNLRKIGARAAQTLLPDDPGGVKRRLSYELENLVSFAVATVEAERGRPVARPPAGEDLYIDFAGPPGTILTYSFSEVFRNRVPADRLRGKTVVIGATAPSLQDVDPTAVGGGQMPGPEIQANAIATVRAGFPLRSGSRGLDLLLIVVMGLLAPLLNLRLSPFRALALTLTGAAAFLVLAQVLFQRGTVVAVVYPLAALALTAVGSLLVDYFTETRERQRLRTIFSRFVPEAVVDEVVNRSGARLGGVRLDATVLFCDLRSFTSFAETLSAEQVIDVLNRYLGEMSGAILDHGGTVVSYMGDGIMAVFGAPIELEDHADRALAAAQEMAFERLPRFNAWLGEQGLPSDFRMGIGLNSGPVMSGNVGSERRMEYTAVGDTTNTAARLEGMTKGSPFQLFVSDATRQALKRPAPALVEHGEVPVRGRVAPLQVWAVPDDAGAATARESETGATAGG